MFWMRLSISLCLVFVPFKAMAEEAPQAPTFVVAMNYTLTGNPGAQNRFENVISKAVEAHQQLDTKRYWTAFHHQMGNPRQYTLARTFNSMKAMDEEPLNALMEAFGQEEVAKLVGDAAVVGSVERGMWVERPDLSTAPGNGGGSELAIWLQVAVNPGEDERFESYLEKVAEATRQVSPDVGYTAYSPVFGLPNIYVFVVPTSYARLDAGPAMPVSERLREAFGEREARRLEAERGASAAASDTLLVKVRPDMSYQPPAE